MINYSHIVAAHERGRKEGYEKAIAEMEKALIKERQDAYLKGFRDGKDYAFGEVRSVIDDE